LVRIPDEEITRLKAEVSLERLAGARGVVLRRAGDDLIGLCPFHDDTEPSLVISPAKNLWHCFGACQAGGSVIDWVMRAEGLSFRHAVELLRAGPPPAGVSAAPAPKRSTVTRLASPVAAEAGDAELLGQVAVFYAETLAKSPEALGYLERRRVGEPAALARFGVGYANRTLGYRLPAKNRKAGAELRSRLQTLGVLRESGHEHFNGSVVFPIGNPDGAVVGMYGRKVRDDLRPGTPKHLYLPGRHRGVWNAEALEAGEVIVCESVIDALSFWCAGFRNVTCAWGVEGFTAEHAAAFEQRRPARVLIAYDRDPAGDRAAGGLAERLIGWGIECFRVEFPHGADANTVAMEAGSPAETLGRFLRQAAWIGAGAPAADSGPAAKEQDRAGGEGSCFAAADQPPTPGSPALAGLPAGGAAEMVGEELRVRLGERRWRVRGLSKVSSFDLLRVNVLVARGDMAGQVFHVDTFDLYSARARAVFIKQAAEELSVGEDVVRRDLGRVLLLCEERAEDAIAAAQAPVEVAVVLGPAEEAAAMELLTSPDLIERIVADFARAGMVGEESNCLVGYLAAVSRKLDRPLAVIVQSTSAAGKSALMEAVLAFVPGEERIRFSAMTGQSLFYMGESDLAHKVLAIAEEEGAERAAYALKLLQSEGELSIASTGKDTTSGRLVTHTYRVVGPTAILLTTTAIDVDEELLNRCIVLTVDEERAQTRAIHARQRAAHTLDGLAADAERARVVKVHQDAQRLLAPVAVVNPFADQLTFADAATRTRRDHLKYLTLIRSIALLHQHQRPRRTATTAAGPVTYIEATPADVALANRLAGEVLGRSLDDLAPGTRRLLDALEIWVRAQAAERAVTRDQVRFSRRQLREALGWGDTALKVHLARLVDLELVVAHRPAPGAGLVYELAWDGAGRDGGRFLPGLVDPATLTTPAPGTDAARGYDGGRSGSDGCRSGSGQAPVGGRSGAGPVGGGGTNTQVTNGAEPAGALGEPWVTVPASNRDRSQAHAGGGD
jgi:DNA primase